MHVLYVIHYSVFGGPHNQALRLDGPLRARGWDTTVLVPDEPGNAFERLTDAGVRVLTTRLHRLRAKPSLRLQWNYLTGFRTGVRAIQEIIRENEIDLVMIGGLVNPHAAIAARRENIPVVWQILDTRTPRLLVKLMMPVVKRLADVVLVTGKDVADAHPGARDFGERLYSYYPPVDVGLFAPNPSLRKQARAELGVADDVRLIGSVSNVNPQKGQMTFVRAAGVLKSTHPDICFAILGAMYPQHAGYVAELEREAENVGLRIGRDLIFHDPGAEVAKFGNALDVFQLTSEPRSEGIPTVLEEAMALGLPTVTTDVGSVREAVNDGRTGFVVPSRDPKAIAAATRILLDDDDLRRRFGEQGRELAATHFAASRCADVHVEAFNAALSHHG